MTLSFHGLGDPLTGHSKWYSSFHLTICLSKNYLRVRELSINQNNYKVSIYCVQEILLFALSFYSG